MLLDESHLISSQAFVLVIYFVQEIDGFTFFALQAIDQGRIYALRYEMCDDMARSPDLTDRDPRRKMWNFLSPIALFAAKGNKYGKNELVPVAIQMDYEPGKMLNTCY